MACKLAISFTLGVTCCDWGTGIIYVLALYSPKKDDNVANVLALLFPSSSLFIRLFIKLILSIPMYFVRPTIEIGADVSNTPSFSLSSRTSCQSSSAALSPKVG